ncbi:MAG: penicillin-binding transpeptidase domain-containing protein [Planctomycetota bacterium]|nr:penicillin-binding transpeptidase domain-containing protein [Planctomycetota bacterium]
MTPSQAKRIDALALAGVGLVQEPRRTYPHKELAGPLIGFANIDGRGARAIEQMEDPWLAGHAQRVGVERDARRRLLPHEGFDPRRSVGGDVALTLDAPLQAEAEAALAEVVGQTGARGGVVVVIEPRTGDLLALAEAPGFDPNEFRTTPYPATASGAFLAAPEPGSTLKPVVVAAGLQTGAIEESQQFDCEEGFFRVPGKTIRDVKPHGLLDPAGILRVSSNIGASKIGFVVGARSHHEMLRAFGFGERSGSGFPDESAGLLRSWRRWRKVDHANVAFGQGINATVVQMASAMATFATGGLRRAPRLVSARRPPGGDWVPTAPAEERRVLQPEVAATVLSMLEGVVGSEGTGRRAGLAGVRVAGKTGTAQKLVDGRYSDSAYRAWFIGAAPADDPRFAIAVMIDEPRGKVHGGGSVAAPLFARVATAVLARSGVMTEPEFGLSKLARVDLPRPRKTAPRKPASAKPRARPVARAESPARKVAPPNVSAPPRAAARVATAKRRPPPELVRLGDRVLLPNFLGLTRGQVQTLTRSAVFRIQLVGQGLAVEQFPAPGTIVAGASAVHVRFEEGS